MNIRNMTVFAALMAAAIGSQASISTYTVDNLGYTSQLFSFSYDGANVTTNGGVATFVAGGTLSGAQASDAFSWTVTGATGWSSVTAAASHADFNSYAAGLSYGQTVGHDADDIGGVNNNFIDSGEVMIFDFDVSGLQAGSVLTLVSTATANNLNSKGDWVLVDTAANTVVQSSYGVSRGQGSFGNWQVLNSNYRLYYAGNTARFRVQRLTVDVTDSGGGGGSGGASDYIYDAITDFPTINAGEVPYYKDTARNALAINAATVSYRDKYARAVTTFDGAAGVYDAAITALRETDGECHYRFLVNGAVVGTAQNGPTSTDYVPQDHIFPNVNIPAGATIAVESDDVSNGLIPEGTGFAYARGRWTTLTLTPASGATGDPVANAGADKNLILPDNLIVLNGSGTDNGSITAYSWSQVSGPGTASLSGQDTYYQGRGRIAISSDGNLRDPDDWGANATMGAILNALKAQSLLVHWHYNCAKGDREAMAERNEYVMQETKKRFELPDVLFNASANLEGTIDHFVKEANKSTATNPLFFILSGPMHVAYQAIEKTDPSIREHIVCISHSVSNNKLKYSDYDATDVLSLGVSWVQITDQNGGNSDTKGFRSKNKIVKGKLVESSPLWDWMKDAGGDLAWIHGIVISYIDYKDVVGYYNDDFDISDAGMMYYLFTNDENGNYADLKKMLLDPLLAKDPTCNDLIKNQEETGVDCGGPCDACPTGPFAGPYSEKDGYVHFPIEDAPISADWSEETEGFPGYMGDSYYFSHVDDFTNQIKDGDLTYKFIITNPGNYQIQVRSHLTGNQGGEQNDSWLASSGEAIDGAWPVEHMDRIKFAQNIVGKWTWDASTKDDDAQAIRQYFKAGEHTIIFAHRSEGHALDHVLLFDYERYPELLGTTRKDSGKKTDLAKIDAFVNDHPMDD